MPQLPVQYVQLGQAPNMAHPVMQYNGKIYLVKLSNLFYFRGSLKSIQFIVLFVKRLNYFKLNCKCSGHLLIGSCYQIIISV